MEKEKFEKLYAGLTGGAGGFAGTETLYIVGNHASSLASLAVAAAVGIAVVVVLAAVLPRKCDEIGKRLPAEES
ncbi:hypothetical protein AKJ41_00925 [candidate division MSBL1 archaeon SCGC-AAA259O05]|uniref:Uncharacterized protein n=1 Tax=candidate division MSBL1 archaeon SCGC-AAA259O05 TaxID=1698271 RepID=A0A133V578_9EURY|nr:hypothetical protein AKJ41_00925 [candidate division MSBL1 archaeon SCGC-AAA259O05]